LGFTIGITDFILENVSFWVKLPWFIDMPIATYIA